MCGVQSFVNNLCAAGAARMSIFTPAKIFHAFKIFDIPSSPMLISRKAFTEPQLCKIVNSIPLKTFLLLTIRQNGVQTNWNVKLKKYIKYIAEFVRTGKFKLESRYSGFKSSDSSIEIYIFFF
jgi:hypothetical protein